MDLAAGAAPVTPILTCDIDAELTCDRGTMRMLLMCALADANLWTRAVGASAETRNHWARRATLIRGLLEQMPPPVNPRDPYEDLPGEPTPEEADARWRERAAADDARRDAKAAAEKVVEPDLEWSTELEVAAAAGMLEPPEETPIDDIEDLLAL